MKFNRLIIQFALSAAVLAAVHPRAQNCLNTGPDHPPADQGLGGTWNTCTPMTASLGGSFIFTKTGLTAGNHYFRFYGSGSPCGIYGPGGSNDLVLPFGVVNPLSCVTTDAGAKAYYFKAANSAFTYIIKTRGNATGNEGSAIIFEIQGPLHKVLSVSQPSNSQTPNTPVTITAKLDGAPSAGENVYLRYSTDDGATYPNVALMTSSGTTATYTIPGQPNNTFVRYYVFTSGAQPGAADADFYTIRYNNNGGRNFIYAESTTAYQEPPVGTQLGATDNKTGTVTFLFEAPLKNTVSLIGSFNNWTADASSQMHQSASRDRFWITKTLAAGNYTYQYVVDNTIKVADPLSRLVLDPANDPSIPFTVYPNPTPYPTGKTTGIVTLLEVGKAPYRWKTASFTPPPKADLTIYELLPRDFVYNHSFQSIIDTLWYLKKLNVNAVELLPVHEFEGNDSWGYNVDFHMALDKYYGTPDKLKELIDSCHQNGIAVILDVVFNHAFGSAPYAKMYWTGGDPTLGTGQPANNSPYFNPVPTHPYNVGNDFNHESVYSQNYMFRALRNWLTEYKVDGLRFDLAKGFTQHKTSPPDDVGAFNAYDPSRVVIWKRIYDSVQTMKPGAYTILEFLGEDQEETELASYGMLPWSNENSQYSQIALGFNSNDDITRVAASTHGFNGKYWNQIPAAANNLVAYMESHDEQRLMYKNEQFGNASGGVSLKDIPTALRQMEAAEAFFYTVPGPKMLWQFGELGYDFCIDYDNYWKDCSHGGRVNDKPIPWGLGYYADARRKRLYNLTASLIYLRTHYKAFQSANYDVGGMGTGTDAGLVKDFHISDPSMNVTVVGNFDLTAQDVNPRFQAAGAWYDYLDNNLNLNVSNVNTTIHLLPGEYRIYTDKKIAAPPAGYMPDARLSGRVPIKFGSRAAKQRRSTVPAGNKKS